MIQSDKNRLSYPKHSNNRKKTKGRKFTQVPLKRVAVFNIKTTVDEDENVHTKINQCNVHIMNEKMFDANKALIKQAPDKSIVNKMSVTNTSRKIF